jgi:hypothetical protein
MTQKTFKFSRRLLMTLSATLSLALVFYLEMGA